MSYSAGAAALLILALPLGAQQKDDGPQRNRAENQPGELGDVRWWRDEAAARLEAKATGKPLLVLFQEVPG